MKNPSSVMFILAVSFVSYEVEAASVTITGQTAGPTPFIAQIQLTATPAASIKSIKFEITPKPGSVTRPVRGTYPAEYLQQRGNYNSQTGAILLPVWGLYANHSNTVNLTYTFTDNSTQPATVMVSTPAYSNACGYTTPTVLQARTNSTTLSYDYMLVKDHGCTVTPVILDTDGQVRWVGTVPHSENAAIFFQNSVYLAAGTILYRMELDGTFVTLADYSSIGVTNTHHNADFGKRGIILEADTAAQVESFVFEVDGLGNLLKTWNLANIISAAMTAGGDTPGLFVKPAPNDWFHNNAVAYKASDGSLLVSSRENFVIALDYSTGAIKWILGDENKHWHQFPSLAAFSLSLGANTLAPIGQHALSITSDGNLLLFDNGKASLNHAPFQGIDRTYSAPRKYQINIPGNTATELWNYNAGQAFYSPFCSSVYEDAPSNYLVDYAILNLATPPTLAELLGLDASGVKIFHYRYPTSSCDTLYNTSPIHFENVVFGILTPPTAVSRKTHGGAGTFDIPLPLTGSLGVECRSGGANGDYQVVTTFAVPVTITNATVTPGNGGTGSVSGVPVVSGNQVTVNLTNVSNAQKITLNLIGVNDGSNTENVSVPMGVLIGDVNASTRTDAGDVTLVRQQTPSTPASLPSWDFRRDVNASGRIDAGDVTLVRQHTPSAIGP
jgi:arylsulfate sulfotransferase